MSQIKLEMLFQDGMVLQREKPIRVWGEGINGTKVNVFFDGTSAEAVVKNQKFMCEIPAHPAAVELTMTILTEGESSERMEIRHISVGDVWLAGGQSNMEYFLRYDAHYAETCTWEKNPNIHMFNVPRLAYAGQERDTCWDSGYWFEEHDPDWENFSAPGYYFARDLQPRLDVPIGIIGCNWGGTPACAWMPEEVLQEEPLREVLREYEASTREAVNQLQDLPAGSCSQLNEQEKELLYHASVAGYAHDDDPENGKEWARVMYGLSQEEQKQWLKDHADAPTIPIGPWHMYRPSGLYHQMLEKVIPYAIKGVIWYQGESDSNHASLYGRLLETMIETWREKWDDEFPFLFVQLAPFEIWLDCSGEHYPEVRRQQEIVSKTVAGTGMISIMDLGMYEDIHPKRKREVGERLALLARGMVYGEDVLCQSPELEKATLLSDRRNIVLEFSHAGDGLQLIPAQTAECVQGQELAGQSLTCVQGQELVDQSRTCGWDKISDRNQIPKGVLEVFSDERTGTYTSRILENKVLLTLDLPVEKTCEIRFAWKNYVVVSIFNSAGLPMKPFTVSLHTNV